MAAFNFGSYVFLPDEEECFVPAKVVEAFKAGQPGKVDREGYVVKLSGEETKHLLHMDDQSNESIANMIELRDLNEASILQNLRLRFSRNEIYTYVGTILVAVNPFKLLPLYTAEMLEQYKEQGHRNSPPHVYSIADAAYGGLTANQKDQSCIVSGESGSGKTETTKIFLQYIAEVSGATISKDKNSVSFEDASLQEQLLKSNPLLEAFGNAKTVRNDNSSRFGKFIRMEFNNLTGNVIGGSIVQYLLEKSRVVAQADKERNYHIFYNLCAGAAMDKEFKSKFRIGEAEDYHYLNQSGVIEVDSISDETDFETLLNSMETVGIDVNEQDAVFRTVAAIMHLGNIEFEQGDQKHADGSKVANSDMLELAAAQFGVKPEALEKALTTTTVRTNRDKIFKVNSQNKATDARDVLAKEVYHKLFEWLVKRINKSLAKKTKALDKVSKDNQSFIGVLDIFGFEMFEWNSFEQLCINYCNEKLQYHFNEHIFKLEQKEYQSEGIDVSQIEFADNQPALDLFEKRPAGIFASLDEEMNIPKGSDKGFLTKLTEKQKKHPNFKGPGVKTTYTRESFTVIHYAGEVMYNVTAFIEKNRDRLSQDIAELMQGSKIDFNAKLIEKSSTKAKDGSLGTKFKDQLSELMKVLNKTEPHFIRCVKPNDEKAGDCFTSSMVLAQLRYAGLLEVCRIRQIGFPVRKPFKEFFRRYQPLAPGKSKDAKGLTAALKEKGLLTKGEFAIGKSKIFLRTAPHNDLEAAREVALRTQAVMVQKVARGFIARNQYRAYMATLDDLRTGIKKRDYQLLKDALDSAGDLPNQGSNVSVVQEAWDLLQRLEEEKRVVKLLKEAIEKRDINALRSAVAAAEEMKFSPPEMKEAQKLTKRIEEEKTCLDGIRDAIDARDLASLEAALKKAKSLDLMENKVAKQAVVLKERLAEEARVIKDLEKAIGSKDKGKLQTALAEATDMGIENDVVAQGEKALDELLGGEPEEVQNEAKKEKEKQQKEREDKIDKLKKELMEAAKEKNLDRIADLKATVLELGVAGKEIDKLLDQVRNLEDVDEITKELDANVTTLETIAESQKGITLGDVKPLSKAIKMANQKGVTEDIPSMKDAVELEQRLMEQVIVQNELQSALEKKDLEQLKRALDHANDLDMNIDLMTKVRKMINDKENARPKSERIHEREQVDMDEDEFEEVRTKNMQQAANDRYRFTKFYRIRTDGDYVKGIYFNKKRVAETKLQYQKTQIPKSVLELDKDMNKLALNIHKSLLGYCGETLMQFPATLAQDILIKGLEQPELTDEIYIQLCKHLTNNPKPESVGRAWQLMCMAVGTFPPSPDFEMYLLNFLLEHVNVTGLVGNYARYSLRRLDGMLIRGASGFVPNIDEILAYKERPPILATIELVDGTPLTEELPITPDLNVEKVLEICVHFLQLQDERARFFGIWVVDADEEEEEEDLAAYSSYTAARTAHDGDEPPPPPPDEVPLPPMAATSTPPRTPRPLRSKDYLGDVVVQLTRQGRAFAFVFKRKIFLPSTDGPSTDPVYQRLMYLQAADDVISGNIPVVKEPDVIQLTATAIACDTEDFPSTEAELLDNSLMEYLPAPWRTKKTDQNWAKAVLASRAKVAKKTLESLQTDYLSKVIKFPLYGHAFFYVRKDENAPDEILSVSNEGVNHLSLSRVPLAQYGYADLHRWGGSSSSFWILVMDRSSGRKNKIAFYTQQARDISSLILDYAVLQADRG